MKRFILAITLLTSFAISQAQMPKMPTKSQQEAYKQFMSLYDSLTPMQRIMFFTEVKHIMDPEVKVVQAGVTDDSAPADAIVLFDGKDLNKEWEESYYRFGAPPTVKSPVTWIIKDGAMESTRNSGSLQTRRSFNDFQLHIEWRTPSLITGEGQGRGNSGVIIEGQYEVQILDSYNNRTYRNGQAGAIYMQYAPLVNVSRKPGEWQSYDIIYTAPRFKDSTSYFTPPRITVFHNGVLVQNNVSIQGPTVFPGIPAYDVKQHGPSPILLQQHGNPVSFRNIWIREL
ncbi:MAG: DUF1080 domain-containing protein [Bacteroidales bacterium]